MDPLVSAAVEKLHIDDRPRPLTPRHTTSWRTAHWKIKTVESAADSAPLLHEVRALALLRDAGLTCVATDQGRVGEGTWTAIGWQEGATLWDWCRPGREGPTGCEGLPGVSSRTAVHAGARLTSKHAHRAFDRLDRLHAAGWRHGDLHPGNIVVTDLGDIEFIDHDLTHHRELLPLPYPYRGGVDHATAPETARQLLDTAPDIGIEPTAAAETYSLGASIRWAWTGVTPSTSRASGPDVDPTDILKDIATGRHRVPLTDSRPWPDPDLEALLDNAMSLNPATRTRAFPTDPSPPPNRNH
ncbi:hypothetical protein [Streptomyces sp. SID3343]|uniref:hypothetical protein n=1 Tax=Streptomyces sp. SID3343 TaxID=2690260 RepID=UPI001369B654|nr:hypothetical protein [Streptomyces sp. SID3343]MYV99238.1 hypothetical protein [Streptomyces sp. SID3343]